MYRFYSDGFFGYSEPGDFRYFSFWHLLPLTILLLAIILTYRKQDAFRMWKHEERFRYVLSFVMLLTEMSYFWRLLYVGDESGQYSMMIKLPLQLCQWGLISAIFMLLSKNKSLFCFCFFVCLIFGSAACLTPTVIVRTGPAYFRYYQFFLEHGLPIYAVCYMMFVHRMRPAYKSIYGVIAVLIPFALLCIYVNNHVPDANFMYLAGYREGAVAGDNIINHLPKGQYTRMGLLFLLSLVLFHLHYFAWLKLFQKTDRKR